MTATEVAFGARTRLRVLSDFKRDRIRSSTPGVRPKALEISQFDSPDTSGDVLFGFENHFIRGQKKMKLRCTLALVVMLAMALGRIKVKQGEHLRSLLMAAV